MVAPALIPRRAGDRVKTGKRDAARLARLPRAGELTAIRVPSPAEGAVRDLCRARADLVDDRPRVRQRLKTFLLRYGRIYRDGSSWAAVTCGGWWCSGSAIRRWMSPSGSTGRCWRPATPSWPRCSLRALGLDPPSRCRPPKAGRARAAKRGIPLYQTPPSAKA